MSRPDEAVTIRAAPQQQDGKPVPPGDVLVRAFNELRDELLSALAFVLGNQDDARDAAQEAFIKCWSARERLGGARKPRAWIFRGCLTTPTARGRSPWLRKAAPR